MSKLVDNACLWWKKLNFHFLNSLFSGIADFFWCLNCPDIVVVADRSHRTPTPKHTHTWVRAALTLTSALVWIISSSIKIRNLKRNVRACVNLVERMVSLGLVSYDLYTKCSYSKTCSAWIQHRWVTLNPNVFYPNLRSIRSTFKTVSQSLLCYSARLIRNLLCLFGSSVSDL